VNVALPAATAKMIAEPALTRLWQTARARLERNGVTAAGSVVIDGLSDRERDAISGLLGRPVTTNRIRVDLAALDRQLRTSPAQRGLADVLEHLSGPIRDRRAERAGLHAEREAVWAAARAALVDAGLAGHIWTGVWLEDLRRAGVLARVDPDVAVVAFTQATRTLSSLPAIAGPADSYTDRPTVARNDLAAKVTGSAHGLDDGTLVAALVIRAVAAALERPPAGDAAGRRELWAAAGVTADEVSTTVLTLGLAPVGGGARNAEMRARTADSVEIHLNARDLRRIEWNLAPGTLVSVCENPRVVEAAADAKVIAPLVCTYGNPTTVGTTLLDLLHTAGARFRYHGDFDGPGIEIANRVITRVSATPWRMTASDYQNAVSAHKTLPALDGDVPEAVWDAELASTMATAGYAVHEELVLDRLVGDLRNP